MRRREFLGAAAATAGGIWLGGCAPRPTPVYPTQSGQPFEGDGPFPSGVGSADPTPDGVLLWTRVDPRPDSGSGRAVEVQVATSPVFALGTMVGTLTETAVAGRDHCVTFDVVGLDPATTYWYRFRCDGELSPVGRTRTTPAPGAGPGSLRIAAFSCQRWTQGWFTAHADLAALAEDPATDIDVVLCLGDYIYDTGYADKVLIDGRDDPVQDARSLQDFRSKYRLYRSDPNLQAVHAAFPMINVFDNHDGLDEPGDPQAPGSLGAFDEHVPIRRTAPGRIHRRIQWGDTCDIFMTDQRQYRDPTLPESSILGTSTEERPQILDPSRTILGLDQRQWLMDGLSSSTAQWRLVGSQLMFWPWRTLPRFPWQPRGAGSYLNMTQWDGYVGERLTILDHLEARDVRDTLMVSGDSHVFSAAHVAPDVDNPASVPRVAEFGTGSISSNNADENGYPDDEATNPFLFAVNPNHLRYLESDRHGYVVVEMGADGATAEVRSPQTIRQPTSAVDVLARFTVDRGTQRVVRTA